MSAPITKLATTALLLFGAAFPVGCYGDSGTECYYYYGYDAGYPICNYDYAEPYTPANGYEAVYYQQVEPEYTPNPDPTVASQVSDASVQITAFLYVARTEDTGDTPADEVLNERYPCGRGEEAMTVCAVDHLRARDTDYILIAVKVEQEVPIEPDVDHLVVGFGFDSDNDALNNYVPPAELALDYFGGNDRWYAATYAPGGEWDLQTYGLVEGVPTAIDSEARVILQEESAVLVVPAEEFLVPVPGARFSYFRHRGDPTVDWSGLVFPPLADPLAGL